MRLCGETGAVREGWQVTSVNKWTVTNWVVFQQESRRNKEDFIIAGSPHFSLHFSPLLPILTFIKIKPQHNCWQLAFPFCFWLDSGSQIANRPEIMMQCCDKMIREALIFCAYSKNCYLLYFRYQVLLSLCLHKWVICSLKWIIPAGLTGTKLRPQIAEYIP